MKIARIHHVSLIVTDLERAVRFYEEVLGLQQMQRPDLGFPGVWFSIGATGQQLHLLVHQGETGRSGGIDTRDGHFALSIDDFDEAVRWLDSKGIAYEARRESKAGFPQIFILDPDHNIIELNITS
ncbi:VOC family protein [Marinicrinis lubricantis]|uniref:VOC family protein n=1 Tax=Marinicrinis lubricantis TaxID=2086470 RepID=A0ABW1INX3_9BACL